MTGEKNNMNFEEALAALRHDEPDAAALEAAAARAWQGIQQAVADPQFHAAAATIRSCGDFRELLAERDSGNITSARKLLLEDHLRECAACRHYSQGIAEPDAEAAKWVPAYQAASFTASWQKLSALAAVFVAAVLGAFVVNYYFFAVAPGIRAKVESVQGGLYAVSARGERVATPGMELQEGELLRTSAGSHAFVRLFDGSRVEMNERAEFAVHATRRNTTVDLQRGNVIVEAAHRSRGHLYVVTPDARVAVTGTIFSVNSGLKGSRVAVVEGNVAVDYNGTGAKLHAGDEVTTTADVGVVPIQKEISWSADLDRYLALLADFTKLKNQLEQIPLPAVRYQSTLLPRVPAGAKVYASIPNLGEALAEANQVFQQQLQQSPVLQQWWSKQQGNNNGPKPEEIIEKVRQFSQYLGDEIVFAMIETNGHTGGIVLAQVNKPGLRDFLQQQLPAGEDAVVYDAQSFANSAPTKGAPLFLVRNDLFVAATDYATLVQANQQLNAGPSGFAQTAFGQHILEAYARGAGFLFAADLKSIVANEQAKAAIAANHHTQPTIDVPADHRAHHEMYAFNFSNLDYILVERRDFGQNADNRATIAFTGQRQGVASWLAAPAPIGSLDFISADASGAVAVLLKDPSKMLTDILGVKRDVRDNNAPPQFVNDIAASFGGDFTLALDGPVLPTPAWRFVIEVNDPQRAQYAIEQALQQASHEGNKSVTLSLKQQVQNGQTFYTITGGPQEIDYTISDGYLVAGPSIAMVLKSLDVHHNGNSLAHSQAFRALLPQGPQLDYSAVGYQNLAPVLQPLAGQLNATELQNLQTIAAGSKPSAVVAYGLPDRIEVQTSSKFFGFDLSTLAMGALLGNNPLRGSAKPGTLQ